MKDVIFLLSKDCVNLEALPMYGNKYWKTPNIDELASKGTVFNRHYTAAASTSMSFSAMISGHYPYEFKSRKEYVGVQENEFPGFFDFFQEMGYETHLIWDEYWMGYCWNYVQLWGKSGKLKVHNLSIAQPAGSHKKNSDKIVRNDVLLNETYNQIYNTLNAIDYNRKQFVWLHLPHILRGRSSYMDDVDAWDNIVGYVRKLVGDDNIYLTADHGHMNMHKGKVGYGFDVYEPIIRIPLITPRIDGRHSVEEMTCNIDLWRIMCENTITEREFIVSDTQYFAQPNRKTAIVSNRFKLIYNRKSRNEELYDLYWDPYENYNILKESYFDKDRIRITVYNELYFYPYREEALEAYNKLKAIRESIWREPSWALDKKLKLKRIVRVSKLYFKNVLLK